MAPGRRTRIALNGDGAREQHVKSRKPRAERRDKRARAEGQPAQSGNLRAKARPVGGSTFFIAKRAPTKAAPRGAPGSFVRYGFSDDAPGATPQSFMPGPGRGPRPQPISAPVRNHEIAPPASHARIGRKMTRSAALRGRWRRRRPKSPPGVEPVGQPGHGDEERGPPRTRLERPRSGPFCCGRRKAQLGGDSGRIRAVMNHRLMPAAVAMRRKGDRAGLGRFIAPLLDCPGGPCHYTKPSATGEPRHGPREHPSGRS